MGPLQNSSLRHHNSGNFASCQASSVIFLILNQCIAVKRHAIGRLDAQGAAENAAATLEDWGAGRKAKSYPGLSRQNPQLAGRLEHVPQPSSARFAGGTRPG